MTRSSVPSQGGQAPSEPLLLALDELERAARDVTRAVDLLTDRAEWIRGARRAGSAWRDIVDAEERPLIAELLTTTISRFESAGTRFRQAKARALHDEGMTMEQIAGLFGVTRQRVSVLLRGNGDSSYG